MDNLKIKRTAAIAQLRAERIEWARKVDNASVEAHEVRFVERHKK